MVHQPPVCPAEADGDLQKRVRIYLGGRYLPSLKRLGVEVHDGIVTLRGRVGTFHEKQVALHCCRRVAGVRHLVDAVEVPQKADGLSPAALPAEGKAAEGRAPERKALTAAGV